MSDYWRHDRQEEGEDEFYNFLVTVHSKKGDINQTALVERNLYFMNTLLFLAWGGV